MARYNVDNPGQISIINNPSNHGLSTVWLLATLGSKSNKRFLRREVNFISIPRTCTVINDSKSSLTLRVTSSLLHGVSLLYKQQVDYLFGDVQVVNGRLQRNTHISDMIYNRNLKAVHGKPIGSIFAEGQSGSSQQQMHVLEDDRRFLIEEEFALGFEDIEVLNKQNDSRYQRIRELQLADKRNNHSLEVSVDFLDGTTLARNHDSTTADYNNFFGIDEESSFDSIDTDYSGGIADHGINDYNLSHVSDDDEQLTRRKGSFNPRKPKTGELEDDEDDLQLDFTLADLEDVNPDILDGEIGIKLDEFSDTLARNDGGDPHFTTTSNETYLTNHNDTTKLNRDRLAVIQVSSGVGKRRKVQLDQSVRFASSEMKQFNKNYNEAMSMALMDKTANANAKFRDLSDIVTSESGCTPKFLNLAYKHIFGLRATRGIPAHRLPHRGSRHGIYGVGQMNSLIEAAEELEVGRHAMPPDSRLPSEGLSHELESLRGGIAEGYDDSTFSLNQRNEPQGETEGGNFAMVMNIPELELQSDEAGASYQDRDGDYDFMEESIDYTPGANHVPTQKVLVGQLNQGLAVFARYLLKCIDRQGERVNSDHASYERLDLHRLSEVTSQTADPDAQAQPQDAYCCIRFDQLVPTRRSQPCTRSQAVKAFSSVLELATRKFASVELQEVEDTKLMGASDIKIYCLC